MTTLLPTTEPKLREVGIVAWTVFVTVIVKAVVADSNEEVAEVILELVVIKVTVELLVEGEPDVTLNPAIAEPS
jgi:hypothetical protein